MRVVAILVREIQIKKRTEVGEHMTLILGPKLIMIKKKLLKFTESPLSPFSPLRPGYPGGPGSPGAPSMPGDPMSP